MRNLIVTAILLTLTLPGVLAQSRPDAEHHAPKDSVVEAILQEENSNSQLKLMAHQLFDSIGPRLVGNTANGSCTRLGPCQL